VTLSGVHGGFAWVVIGANAAVGLWALGAQRFTWLRRRSLWWATVVAELTVFVEVALGAGLLGGEGRQGRQAAQFHAFYGFVAIVAVGVLYSYRAQLRHRIYLLYGLGGLFVMGLAIRAFQIPARP